MQEMVVEDDSLRHKSHERVYKELGGKADRNLGRFLKQTSPMLGEYYCTIKSLPSAPGSEPDDCKVYVFSDSVLIALVQKNLKRSKEPRNGIIDFAGQQSIIKFASARDSWLRRFPGKYRLIHWLDLRQCKFKFDKPSSINVRYILRTREAAVNPDDHARVVTRIASYELDFSHLDFGSVVRDRLHDDLVGSQASLGIAGSRKSTHRSSVRVSRHRWSTQSTDSSLQRRRSAIALQRSSIGHSRASVERKSERPLSTSSNSSASSRISGRASIAALRRSADIQSRYLS